MAFDAFLKIEGIDGESIDKTHPGEIEVSSFSWGVSQTATSGGGSGGGTGKAVLQDFNFSMRTSKASPYLMLSCATGRHMQKAVLTCRKAGFEFLKIRLDDVLVSSYDLGGDTGGDSPNDSISLNFVRIDFLYSVQRTGETVEAAFDTRGGIT